MDKPKVTIAFIVLLLLSSLWILPTEFQSNATAIAENDWSMFHHDPAHTGFTNSSAPTSMPNAFWSAAPYDDLLTSPAIVNGIVYMTGYTLYAYNASNGKTLWTAGGKGYTAPIVDNDIIYAGAAAFNASTGAELWNINGSILAVANGYLYTVDQQGLVGRNASSGSKIWEDNTYIHYLSHLLLHMAAYISELFLVI